MIKAAACSSMLVLLLLASCVAAQQNEEPTYFALNANGTGSSPEPSGVFASPSPSSPSSAQNSLNGAGNGTNETLSSPPQSPEPSTALPSPVVISPGPAQGDSSATDSSATAPQQLATVDQLVPHFRGVQSCLPFNILVAAPLLPQGNNTRLSSDGRITITAEPAVINATRITLEDGILTLSVSQGFYAYQPINFTVTVPPAGGELESITNSGTGVLVLGPGLNTSTLRATADSVGQIRILNATIDTLIFSGAGVLASSLSGAFNQVLVNTGAATGTVVVSSVNPVNMSVNLGGLTTLLLEAPEGSSILGQAAALAKVQYTNGSCAVIAQRSTPAPSSSLFGASGDIFGSKCFQVPAETVRSSLGAANNPQWTCGVAVDGQLSCSGSNATSAEEIPLKPVLNSGNLAAVSGPTTLPANTSNNTAGNSTAGTNAGNSGGSPSPSGGGSNTASPSPAVSPSVDGFNTAASPSSSTGGSNTAPNSIPSPSPSSNTGSSPAPASSPSAGGSNTGSSSSPAPPSSGSNTGNGVPATESITGNTAGSPNAGLTGTATVEGFPAGQNNTTPGGRRLLMPLSRSGAGRRLLQLINFPSLNFPIIPVITNFTPSGVVSTGGFTQGPGSSTYSSSSTTTPEGTSQQTTTSSNGSPPVTTGVFIPSRPLSSPSPSPASPSPEVETSSEPNSTSPAPSPSPAPSAPIASSISTGGQGGLTVVNTQCAVDTSGLDMLLPPEETQAPSPSPTVVNNTGSTNTPTGQNTSSNAAASPAVNAASPAVNAASPAVNAASPAVNAAIPAVNAASPSPPPVNTIGTGSNLGSSGGNGANTGTGGTAGNTGTGGGTNSGSGGNTIVGGNGGANSGNGGNTTVSGNGGNVGGTTA